MRYYRQHPIILLSALIEGLLLAGLGVGLALLFRQLLFLLLLVLGLLLALWRCIAWVTFSIRIEGRQVTMRTLNGFVVNERIVSLNAPGGIRLRQNLSGWMFDYGLMRIEVFGTPVQVRYIAPFSTLKRQIEGS
jgi:hypothetical protein